MRRALALSLFVSVVACSGKKGAPASDPPAPPARSGAGDGEPAVSPEFTADQLREAALAGAFVRRFERDHLRHHVLDDTISAEAFDAYLKQLDFGKLFLLTADREALAVHAQRIDDELHAGDLALAHEGAARFVARVAVVEKIVAELLAAPLDHDDEEVVELDPDKLRPAATDAELRERWRQRLELELLERTALPLKPAKGDPAPAPLAEREAKARAALATSYAGRFARLRNVRPIDASADLLNAVASVFDPHTEYLPPSDKANFDINMSGSLEGIGAVLRERDHYVEVAELVAGGAAWRQGQLAAGDLILAVTPPGGDVVDIADMHIDDVVKMIRGPKGTDVRLKVKKDSGAEQVIDITRDVVVLEATYARGAIMTGKGLPKLGYVYLPSFYGGQAHDSATDVRALLTRLRQRDVAGVVLDLRGNGGGYLEDAVTMSGLFIDRGPVVQVADGAGEREVLDDDEPGTAFDRPVVVLVDRFSASASEIVAAALQDYRRAVVVGTSATHGKGTVQSLVSLDRDAGGRLQLGSLKLTFQQFYRVNGASTQLDGVSPDIGLPDPTAYVDSREGSLPHAIAASRIDAADHADWAASADVPALRTKSAARVAKQPLFAKVDASVVLLKARREDTLVPLARPAWEARRAAQQAAIDAVTIDLTKVPPGLKVELLDPPPPPVAGERVDDRMTKWGDSLARDPWLDEAVRVLADMSR
ncbi:MAG: carboxy terminal-processing peptidase [Myxococcales bacterium]|nr:carboxy terminal-processing peptidase [Myxococcales bacterium]